MKTRTRVWDKTFEEMKYNGFILFPSGEPHYAFRDLDNDEIVVGVKINGIVMPSIKVTQDINGKEIFDGDVLSRDNRTMFSPNAKPTIVEVYYDKEKDRFSVRGNLDIRHFRMFQLRDFEVIGNIYENPDLVKLLRSLKKEKRIKMKYRVGDIVKIKTWDELCKEFGFNKNGTLKLSRGYFNVYMKEFCGKEVMIEDVNTKKGYYRLKEDYLRWDWVEELIKCKVIQGGVK